MSAQVHVPSLFSRAGTVSALTLVAVGGTLVAPGGTSQAQAASAVATKAVKVAASKQGSPYRWGATGPNSFDCSGLTVYSYKKAGKSLPRTTQQQYNSTEHVSAAHRRKGDLVFFHSDGYAYHVGIYAGHGRIWHAPKTGSTVRLERIWTKNVWYGRVA
ncbi:C40 family peptidase [Streptomyces montanisoli]|uniref:C40 family peptidase n=1 Tax=Streptomyces montanisoli TaxID=2798581 RepID=A0A940MDA4_9ACTN|nr:C40 family peptidase [Streptomyces montanisoli]MBP0459169.1 C40 family peptidase [Streptomyces montanisoli]